MLLSMTWNTGAHLMVRRSHEERVMKALRQYGALSRAEISERVQLSRTTTSEITASLLERRAITAVRQAIAVGRGRPAELLAIDPAAGQVIGLDFSHAQVRIAVADASHEIIAQGKIEYKLSTTWAERANLAFGLLESFRENSGVHFESLNAIGIGFPGPFSEKGSRLALGRDGKDPQAVEAARELLALFKDRFDAPVTIDNNARLAGLGEAIWGSTGGTPKHLVYLRLDQGVGGALVIDGSLATGAFGYAGEIGHVTAVHPSGKTCRCGKRGCLETVASVPAVLAACAEQGLVLHTLEELRVAAHSADPIVLTVLHEVGDAVGRVLGGLAVAVDPSEIVVGGALMSAAPQVLEYVQAAIRYQLIPIPEAAPIVRAAVLGDDAGARGAIAAVLRRSSLLERYETHHEQ